MDDDGGGGGADAASASLVSKLQDLQQRINDREAAERLTRQNKHLQAENDALVNTVALMEIHSHGNANVVLAKQADRDVTLRELLLVIKSLARHETEIDRVRADAAAQVEAMRAQFAAAQAETTARQQLAIAALRAEMASVNQEVDAANARAAAAEASADRQKVAAENALREQQETARAQMQAQASEKDAAIAAAQAEVRGQFVSGARDGRRVGGAWGARVSFLRWMVW
jgi:hypothetical protein